MSRPSLVERVAVRVVAAAAWTAGSTVVATVALSDAIKGRSGPPHPRNT